MKFRLIIALLLMPLPSLLKVPAYRLFLGYKIGKKVRIGLSAIAVENCAIGDRSRIGHFNIFYGTKRLEIGEDVIVKFFNRVWGGELLRIGNRCIIDRFNEINAILNPLAVNDFDSRFLLGDGSIVTVSHKIDFTDRVEFGENVVFAGRNSNIWTHNRQKSGPVSIGRNCYVGANVQFVANSSVGEYCVVGLGSIITKPVEGDWAIIAGMPAERRKALDEDSKILVTYPTRPDLDGEPEAPQAVLS